MILGMELTSGLKWWFSQVFTVEARTPICLATSDWRRPRSTRRFLR